MLLPWPHGRERVHLIVDRVVRDLNVTLASDCMQQLQDRVRVLPPVDVPNSSTRCSQITKLTVTEAALLLVIIGIVVVVDAHVDHHIHRVRDVTVQVCVPALGRLSIHASPGGTTTECIVHLGPQIRRDVLSWEVLGKIEHAIARCVLRKWQRLHEILKVLGHLDFEVLCDTKLTTIVRVGEQTTLISCDNEAGLSCMTLQEAKLADYGVPGQVANPSI